MASEENIAAGVFELRADGSQFRAEIANTVEVTKRFERVVLESFNKAGTAASATGALESSSKRYISAIEREAAAIERKTASLVLSATEIRRAEAAARGEVGAEAAIGKLDAAEKAYKRVSAAAQQAADVNAFGDMLAKSQALGQVEKNIDKVGEAIDKAGDIVDEKTGGKFAAAVDKVQDAAKDAADKMSSISELRRAALIAKLPTSAQSFRDADDHGVALAFSVIEGSLAAPTPLAPVKTEPPTAPMPAPSLGRQTNDAAQQPAPEPVSQFRRVAANLSGRSNG